MIRRAGSACYRKIRLRLGWVGRKQSLTALEGGKHKDRVLGMPRPCEHGGREACGVEQRRMSGCNIGTPVLWNHTGLCGGHEVAGSEAERSASSIL